MGSFTEIIESLNQIDQNVTLFINSLNSPVTDAIWSFFSNRLVWIPLYLLIAFFLFHRLGWKKALIAIAAVALTIVACDQVSNLIKGIVCRPRPCHTPFMLENGLHLLEDKGRQYGFVSGHAANSMGFAIASYRCFTWNKHITFKKYRAVMVFWALLVGISRVFAGKHFLGDVLAGFVVGWILAVIITAIAGFFARRVSRR